jgi:bifunctional non-homologous end joining protein LigD
MPLPRVQPIAPTWRKEPFDDPDWLFEFKYDGFRALCYLEQRRNRLISRNGNIMTRFDELADQVAGVLDVDDAILDGEVIAADETGRPQFYDLLCGTRSPCYVAFDLLWPTASTCGLCRSASAGRRYGPSCRRDRRSCPRRCRSKAGGASCSN